MDMYEKIFLIICGATLFIGFISLIQNWLDRKKANKELRILLIGEALLRNNESFINLFDDLMELRDMIDKNGLITIEDRIEQTKKIDIINQKRHDAVETFIELMNKLGDQI